MINGGEPTNERASNIISWTKQRIAGLKKAEQNLTIDTPPNTQAHDEVQNLAQQMWQSLKEKDQLEKELREGEIDDTTKLLTKDATFKKLEERLNDSLRTNVTETAIYLDVNELKEINDELGHDAGDELLRNVGEAIKEEIREVDIAGRIGGDEGLIILHNTSPKEAILFWKRVKENLAKRSVRGREIKVSAGAAILKPSPGMDPKIILREAEAAMYISKYTSKENKTIPELVLYDDLEQSQKQNIKTFKRIAGARQPATRTG